MSNEFIDSYSDDQISLESFEEAAKSKTPELSTYNAATLSRLWAITSVGSIECMIKSWAANNSYMSDIYDYFQGGPNSKRVKELSAAFALRGIEIEAELFHDLIAVKIIRNAYTHASWHSGDAEYLQSRGFPTDMRNFEESHLNRIKEVHYHLMMCMGKALVLSRLINDQQA